MPTQCSQDLFDFGTVEGREVVGAFDGGDDHVARRRCCCWAADKAIGLVARSPSCFQDGRDPDVLLHTMPTLLGQRIFGIALGYEDLNDHDQLRHDPVLGVLAGKLDGQALELRGARRQVDAQPAGARRQDRQRSPITRSTTTARRSSGCS